MINLFKRYATIGILNTALHWLVFILAVYVVGASQALGNLLAFCVAVTFSFALNSIFTFKRKASGGMYFSYVAFMGGLSLAFGYISDLINIEPIVTLILFSMVSLVVGFLFSRYVVFRDAK